MYEDNPERRVLFNLLRGLYAVHPVRLDIAGTVESIAEITPELLYGCYETFYNLHNMVLAVSGNVTPEQVLRVADRMLRPGPDRRVERAPFSEPREAVSSRVEDRMPVAAPCFIWGIRCRCRPKAAFAAPHRRKPCPLRCSRSCSAAGRAHFTRG